MTATAGLLAEQPALVSGNGRPATGDRIVAEVFTRHGSMEHIRGRVIAVVDDERAVGGYVVLCRFWHPDQHIHSFQVAQGGDWSEGRVGNGRRVEIIEKKETRR